jgi:hypothetical protein
MLTEEPDIAAESARVRPEYAAGNRGFRGGQFGVIVNHNTLYCQWPTEFSRFGRGG